MSNVVQFPPNAAFTRVLSEAMPDEAVRVRALADAEVIFTAYRIHRKRFDREGDDREMMLDALREELGKLHGTTVARERSENVRVLLDSWEGFVGSELDT